MERKNNLSNNLRAYQELRKKNSEEFSQELNIPKSTLRSIIASGNTTLYTAIHIANALEITLDELVYGEVPPGIRSQMRWLLHKAQWYAKLPFEKQDRVLYHMNELLKILTINCE